MGVQAGFFTAGTCCTALFRAEADCAADLGLCGP